MNDTGQLRDAIISKVLEALRETGNYPASVFQLCRALEISEKDFFQIFPNIESVEATHWLNVMDHNIRSCESSEEWAGFNAQQRLLTFYYRFFDDALAHRSLLLLRFAKSQPQEPVPVFSQAEGRFKEFVGALLSRAVREKEIADRGKLNDLYEPALLLQLRLILQFHLKDASPGFEKTDALIEKSVRLTFDLLKTSALESALDLAKWMHCQSRSGSYRAAASQNSCGA